jgi:hypothetical protein
MRKTTGYVTTDGAFFEIHHEQKARDHETKLRLESFCKTFLSSNVFRDVSSEQLANQLFEQIDTLRRIVNGIEDANDAEAHA